MDTRDTVCKASVRARIRSDGSHIAKNNAAIAYFRRKSVTFKIAKLIASHASKIAVTQGESRMSSPKAESRACRCRIEAGIRHVRSTKPQQHARGQSKQETQATS